MIVTWLCKTCGDSFKVGIEAFEHRKTYPPHHDVVLVEEPRLTGIEKESLHAEIHLIARNYGS